MGKSHRVFLFRSNPVEEGGDDGKDYVREPECYGWWEGSCVDEHLTEPQEEDVCEG